MHQCDHSTHCVFCCRIKQLEGKLATLTIINGALQNENETLREEVASARAPRSANDAELHELQEEFTRRLATADRTIAGLKVSMHAHSPLHPAL